MGLIGPMHFLTLATLVTLVFRRLMVSVLDCTSPRQGVAESSRKYSIQMSYPDQFATNFQ